MDFNMKQWRNQEYESEEHNQQLLQQQQHHHSAKIPKLLSNTNPRETQYQKPELLSGSALPLFVPEQHHQQQSPNKLTNHLSATQPFNHHQPTTPTPSSRLPRMGSGYFSSAQWQELELQALIFRYMLAGAAVPSELLQPIKKSLSNLLNSPHYFLHHHQHHHSLPPYYPHYQPAALFQSGYWGRAAMDPEPGRCRRTDGKKWRCSRDVVVGQKYCERHMHRGRNRSRKPVETTTLSAAAGKIPGAASSPAASGFGGTHFTLSGKMPSNTISDAIGGNAKTSTTTITTSASIDHLRVSRSSSDVKRENKHAFDPNIDTSGKVKSDGHVLRHFFDDWPRSQQEPDNAVTAANTNASSSRNYVTSLSISMPGNLSSDVSLKLSTGDGDGPGNAGPQAQSERQMGWASGWGSSPMGGPLAEALRSANSNSSPTSVLHQLQRGPASETCIVSS